MSVMAIMLTRDDLDALPDDGLRHELIDGAFVMTPPPGLPHQSMVGALYVALLNASNETGLKILFAPFAVALGPNVVEPDLLVAPTEAFTQRAGRGPQTHAVRGVRRGFLLAGRSLATIHHCPRTRRGTLHPSRDGKR